MERAGRDTYAYQHTSLEISQGGGTPFQLKIQP